MLLNDFKNKHKGQRCFIIGNGPSLNDIDLDLLKDEITFGTNRIYLKGFVPSFYVCCNPLVLSQFWDEIIKLPSVKFLSNMPQYAGEWRATNFPIVLDTSLTDPAFSSPEGPIWEGHTVTYVCLQLAYYMGFDEVILVGCDHDYGPIQAQPNQEITGQDFGHFHPDYFKGVKWNAPDLGASEFAYSLAAAAYKRAGRKVLNASAHSKLEAFERVSFNQIHFLGRDTNLKPKVSAIVSAYKCPQFVEGLLKDLAGQTLGKDLEVVFVTQYDSQEYKLLYETIPHAYTLNVKLCLTENIPTIYEAWNIGIKAASGKYITNANADDRHHPRAYELAANVLDGRPDIDLVYHDAFITWQPNQTFFEFFNQWKGKEIVTGRVPEEPGVFNWCDYSREILTHGCFIGPQPMWRATLHQRFGYFDTSFESAGDYEFWLRCAGERNYLHIPRVLGLYYASTSGIEMSQPERAANEAVRAQARHMSPGLDIGLVSKDDIRLQVGDRFIYTKVEDFLDRAAAVRLGGEPKVDWS